VIALRRVLVPTDFSEPSAKALGYGKALAGAFYASLHVLHVVQEPFVHGWTMEGYVAALPDFRTDLEAQARDRLQTCLTEAERGLYHAELAVRVGQPYMEILAYAKDREVDLIVVGTHGRGGLEHFLLGSVAERVVRASPCPVLTVRPSEHDFVE
jgi:nucleotide-binding universal stress UspA family protein